MKNYLKIPSFVSLLMLASVYSCAVGEEHRSNRTARGNSDANGKIPGGKDVDYQMAVDFKEGQSDTPALGLADEGFNLAGVEQTITIPADGAFLICDQTIVGATDKIELQMSTSLVVQYQELDGTPLLKNCRIDLRKFSMAGITYTRTRNANESAAAPAGLVNTWTNVAVDAALTYTGSNNTSYPVVVKAQPTGRPTTGYISSTSTEMQATFESPQKFTVGNGQNTSIANKSSSSIVKLNAFYTNPFSISSAQTVLAYGTNGGASAVYLAGFDVNIAVSGTATGSWVLCVKRSESDSPVAPNSVTTVNNYLTSLQPAAANGGCFGTALTSATTAGVKRISLAPSLLTAGSSGAPWVSNVTSNTKFTFMIYKVNGTFTANNATLNEQALDANGDVLVAVQNFTVQ